MASNEQHKEIKAALERYTKEELIDLMEHLLRIYVLGESVQLDTAVHKPECIKDLAGYSFPQIMAYLQSNLELDELGKFRITPYTVYVSIGEAEFDLNGPTPTLSKGGADEAHEEDAGDEEEMTPAERMDALDNKPWRSAPRPKTKKPAASSVETPSMADLFADDSRDHGFVMFNEAPTRAGDDELDEAPPIADVAPGDDPEVPADAEPSNDFAKTAATRDEKTAAATPPAAPPPLAAGDKQINPSNRFASLDLD